MLQFENDRLNATDLNVVRGGSSESLGVIIEIVE